MSVMKQIKEVCKKIWLLEKNTTLDNFKRITKQHSIEFKMIDSWAGLTDADFEKYRIIFYFMLASMNLDGCSEFYFINKKER